ncbi:MAG: UDP-3-O-acyl-N-acetylglucosamine deacetylase [Elusimicrobiota bacterium]|nr:UDP-3-O-acyl-N-acetylglucosamine deacetylase [Elusimicrobiota bacterium]
MAKQTTIYKEISIEGIGLHTGKESKIVFKPSLDDKGIRFVRVDLEQKTEIEANWRNAVSSQAVRGSVIKKDDAFVYTIEHILASAHAFGIDNLTVEINCSEPPILDGSAKMFAKALLEAGIKELESDKLYYTVREPMRFEIGKSKYCVFPCDRLEIDCTISFDHPFLQVQHFTIAQIDKDSFINEIAPAKTFCFDYEIEALRKNGLALGGSMDNAIVIGINGIHNEEPLRYGDEFVRHKVLDLVGDLYLAGRGIKGQIVAERPGHKNNIDFVREFVKKAELVK